MTQAVATNSAIHPLAEAPTRPRSRSCWRPLTRAIGSTIDRNTRMLAVYIDVVGNDVRANIPDQPHGGSWRAAEANLVSYLSNPMQILYAHFSQ